MVWIVLAGGIAITVAFGIPIGIGLGLTGLVLLKFFAGNAAGLAAPAVWNVFTDFLLSAVPMFIYLGDILLASGISTRLYTGIAPLFRRIPGQLLHSNIAVCTVFGAICGSSMSTAAAVGSAAYPELSRRGYDRPVVVATLAAGGTLGLLIPPSLSLLIYGATQQVSIGRLFLAGILPGLMIAAGFMTWILFDATRRPHLAPRDAMPMAASAVLAGVLRLWPVSFLVTVVLGSIYAGWATPTEAAGCGVIASIVLGFTWGDLTPRKLFGALWSSTVTFGAIGVVIMGALILGQAISLLTLPQQVVASIAGTGLPKYAVLALVAGLYLVLGCFFDGTSLLLMTLPIVYPVLTALGFDAVWLGVVLTILIEVGMLTPPVGVNLFVLVAVANGDVSLMSAARASVPYWIILLAGIVALCLFPRIALLLPDAFG